MYVILNLLTNDLLGIKITDESYLFPFLDCKHGILIIFLDNNFYNIKVLFVH